MNNCVVRTVLSAVMGSGMGVMFGIFMGTMDTVGRPCSCHACSARTQLPVFQAAPCRQGRQAAVKMPACD